MKTQFGLLLFAVALRAAAFAAGPFTEALQKGLLDEEVNHDYAAAARAYESAVRQADAMRQAGATAVFRLGECYRRLGRTNDAVAAYERILRDYSGETNLVKLSRENLVTLGALSTADLAANPAGSPATATSVEAAQLAAQLASIEGLKDDPEKQGQAVQAFFPDDGLLKMLRQVPKLKEQLAYYQAHPDFKTNRAWYTTFDGNLTYATWPKDVTLADAKTQLVGKLRDISARIEFILGVQRARLQVLQAAAGAAPAVATRPAMSPAEVQSLQEKIKLVEQELVGAQKKVENGRAGPDEVRKVQRDLIHLQRQLPENAAKERQMALIQQELKLADEDLQEVRRQIAVGAAPPLDEIAARRDVLSLQRELAAAQRAPATTTTAATDDFGTADPPATKEEADELQRIKAIIQDSPDLVNARKASENGGTPLHKAAANGYLAVTEFLLSNKADVNAQDNLHRTPLHIAAQNGHKRLCEILLAAGANVNAADPPGVTPLRLAAQNGFVEVAEVLLAKGANVNAKANMANIGGTTPLCVAARNGFPAVVELLLKHGADINAADQRGDTPLMGAILQNQPVTVKLLLEIGADVNVSDSNRYTALFFAVRDLQPALVELLLDHHANLEAPVPALYRDNQGNFHESSADKEWTVLFAPVGTGNTNLTRLLLDHGANLNAKAASGITPVHWAVLANARDTLKLLLAHKPELNVRDSGSNTPLQYAVDAGRTDLVDLLLNAGADPNLPGWTSGGDQPWFPLFRALALLGDDVRQPIVKALLQHGADLNAKTANGWTTLHLAAQWNKNDAAELLVASKADVNARGNRPKDIPTLAERKAPAANNESAGAILPGPGRRIGPGFPGAPMPLQGVPMMQYGAFGQQPSFEANQDVTPLHVAVANQNLDLVKFLLAHGAEVNARDANGRTSLHFAVNRRDPDLIRVLLDAKADPNAKDSAGDTPLAMAEKLPNDRNMYSVLNRGQFTQAGADEIVALLREHGAQDLDQITVTRHSTGVAYPVFRQGTNTLNRFTLLEAIAALPWGAGQFVRPGRPAAQSAPVPFPEFSKVTVTRRDPKTGKLTEIPVDVAALVASEDSSKDIPLEWGDAVNIPDREHKLNEQWQGLPADFSWSLAKCLERKVTVVVKGQPQTVTLSLASSGAPVTDRARSADGFWTEFRLPFHLKEALTGSARLLSTSDLTRVKVRRVDPATGQTNEWIFNEQTVDPNNDLWLRDGDVIEVPEK
jgi:ankyrin repeat protein/tetratricopeptide (TPR) repeat protein